MRIPPNILTFLARRLLIDARRADLLPIRYPVGAWAGSESRVHTRGKFAVLCTPTPTDHPQHLQNVAEKLSPAANAPSARHRVRPVAMPESCS